MWMFFIIDFFLCMSYTCLIASYQDDGICSFMRFGYRHYVCCPNYELSDGKCVECENGFRSYDGESCTPCTSHYFGRKCASVCTCRITERYDNVKGCVDVSPRIKTTTKEERKIPDGQSTDDHVEGHTIEIRILVQLICTVLVFLLLVSLVFVSLTCICWKYELTCKKRERISVHTNSIHPNESGSNPLQGEPHQYDEVDDGFLNRESSINDGQGVRNSESSNGGSGICGVDSDGYMNPYNALQSIETRLDSCSSSDQQRIETSFIHTQENTIYFTDQMQN